MGLPAHSPPYNFFPPHHHHHHHHHHRHQLSAVSLIHFLEPFLYNEEAQPLSPTCLAAVSYSCFFAIMASFDPDRYDEEMLLSMAKECNDYAKECSLPTTFSNATNDATFSVVYKRARDLTEADKSIIMSILESNMKTHYEKTWGWKPLEKSKELFHPDSTFICLYPTVAVVSTNDASASVTVGVDASSVTSSSSSGKTTTELVGYSMFRFEWDDEEEPEHPVLYCYELQLAAELHGQRIGSKVCIDVFLLTDV